MADDLLERLAAAKDPAEKAALVAHFVLANEEPALAELVPVLAFLRWFDEPVVRALLPESEKPRTAELFTQLSSLPFVEPVSRGLAVHDLTRQGLLAESAPEQRLAAAKAADVYADKSDAESLLRSLYCLVLGEQKDAAQNLLEERLNDLGGIGDFDGLSAVFQALEEAESLVGFTVIERTALYWFARGLARQELGDLLGAEQDYDRAISLDPRNAAVYNNRGLIRSAQGDLAGALADYNRAITLDPNYAPAYRNRRLARLAQGDLVKLLGDMFAQSFRTFVSQLLTLRNRDFFRLDILLLASSPLLAFLLRTDSIITQSSGLELLSHYADGLLLYTSLSIGLRPLIFQRMGLYRRFWRYASIEELGRIAWAVVLSTLLLLVIVLASRLPVVAATSFPLSSFSSSVVLIDGLLIFIAVAGARFSLRLATRWQPLAFAAKERRVLESLEQKSR